MAAVIGKIASNDGTFYAKMVDGSLRQLVRGDEVYEGEIVIGDKNNGAINSIIIAMLNGEDVVLLGAETQLFDTSLSNEAFSKEETVTTDESIQTLINQGTLFVTKDEMQHFDEINTSAGDETTKVVSTEYVRANFAQIEDEVVAINAELKELDAIGTIESVVAEDELRFAVEPDATVARLTVVVNNLILVANDTAQSTQEVATAAIYAAQIALDNPTDANIANAAQAASNTVDAAVIAKEAAQALAVATEALRTAAAVAGENVGPTLLAATTSQENIITVILNTQTVAENTAITAANLINAEIDSDAAVSDLLTSANNAADIANAAITAAEQAADTLAANDNPTSADIATANNAIDAADAAIAT
ncbi:MAG: hypothetical protein PHH41_11510, partial [Sulfurimonas sp.]|nr:hypothetical protein [Sulfurimonas sp.]